MTWVNENLPRRINTSTPKTTLPRIHCAAAAAPSPGGALNVGTFADCRVAVWSRRKCLTGRRADLRSGAEKRSLVSCRGCSDLQRAGGPGATNADRESQQQGEMSASPPALRRGGRD